MVEPTVQKAPIERVAVTRFYSVDCVYENYLRVDDCYIYKTPEKLFPPLDGASLGQRIVRKLLVC